MREDLGCGAGVLGGLRGLSPDWSLTWLCHRAGPPCPWAGPPCPRAGPPCPQVPLGGKMGGCPLWGCLEGSSLLLGAEVSCP